MAIHIRPDELTDDMKELYLALKLRRQLIISLRLAGSVSGAPFLVVRELHQHPIRFLRENPISCRETQHIVG